MHIIQINLRLFAMLVFLMFLVSDVKAKEWRSIVPLKSTKADVERSLGKPNRLGRYEIGNERATVLYSEGPCERQSQPLARVSCECLVPKDTVLEIAVTLDSSVKVSKLGIDKKKYQRTPFHAYHPTATYSNFTEGVVYTIRESDDTVTSIDYLPSAKDCEEIIRSQAVATATKVWQGIVPLRSARADVERLLGPPKSSLGEIYIYRTTDDRVDVSYSDDPCKTGGAKPRGTPADVVLKITISPQRSLPVQNLRLDKGKYTRVQNDHPENWVHYLNSEEGITVDAMLDDGCEEVIRIIYQATPKDRALRCGTNPESPAKKLGMQLRRE